MVNCAHPTHFSQALEPAGDWRRRLVGLRANSSVRSHAELDEAAELDEGDPLELGAQHAALRDQLAAVRVLGGLLRHRRPPCGRDRLRVDDALGSCPMPALDAIADWPVGAAAAAVVGPSGVVAAHGDTAHRFDAGVGDEAVGGPRRSGRDRGGRGRARHPRGSAGIHRAASAGARLRILDALAAGDVATRQAPRVLQLRVRRGRRNRGEGSGHRIRAVPGRGRVRTAGHDLQPTSRRFRRGRLRGHVDGGGSGGFRC